MFATSKRCLLLQLHISMHEDNVLFTNTKRERAEEPRGLGTEHIHNLRYYWTPLRGKGKGGPARAEVCESEVAC